jgi:hypothetical protein
MRAGLLVSRPCPQPEDRVGRPPAWRQRVQDARELAQVEPFGQDGAHAELGRLDLMGPGAPLLSRSIEEQRRHGNIIIVGTRATEEPAKQEQEADQHCGELDQAPGEPPKAGRDDQAEHDQPGQQHGGQAAGYERRSPRWSTSAATATAFLCEPERSAGPATRYTSAETVSLRDREAGFHLRGYGP